MVPEGWTPLPLRALLEGHSPGYWGSPVEGNEDGIPVLRSTNFRDDGFLDLSDVAYRSVPQSKIEQKGLRSGDLLLESSGGGPNKPVGRVVIFDSGPEGEYLFTNFLRRLRPRSDRADACFLLYLLWDLHRTGGTKLFQHQTTGIRNLNYKEYLRWEYAVPPLPEQRKIAAILSSVDDAIAATRKVIEQTKRVKQGLLQTLMTRGIGHARFKMTEIGKIPEAWEIIPLGEGAALQTGPFGSQLKASAYTAAGVPVVMPSDLHRGRVDASRAARVPENVAARLAKHRLQEGDIVFARRGEIGRSALIGAAEAGWLCGTGCLRARTADRLDPRFLYLAVSRHWSCQWLEANALGQTMLNLNTSILGALPVPLPPRGEQRMIAEAITTPDPSRDRSLETLVRLRILKRGLMQDLLTGRVRV